MQTGWDECLKVGHSLSHQPLPWGLPTHPGRALSAQHMPGPFYFGGQNLILNCSFSLSCAQALSCAVQQGPEDGYGSVPVTLPALAGGRKCLNLGQSLTAAPRGSSGFLFVAFQKKRITRLHSERISECAGALVTCSSHGKLTLRMQFAPGNFAVFCS